VAVAYALSTVAGRLPFVVVGTSHVQHLQELVSACNVHLSPEDLHYLENGSEPKT
jgi:aryl-alcohol dehydrogenase-like predicted oxidoreductase